MVPTRPMYEGVKTTLKQNIKVKDATTTLNNDQKMPVLGLGTYKIRGTETIYNVIDSALKTGYRSFDTAAVYGNEEAIGSALSTLLPKYGLKRKDIFITSKLAPIDQGALRVTKAVEKSLQNLRVDYIDLYLIHWPGVSNVPVDKEENRTLRRESWEGLVSLCEKGILKAIGVSNYTYRHLDDLLSFSSFPPAVNQVEFHPYFRQSDELLTLCGKHNIVLQAYCSFGGTGVVDLFQDKKVVEISKKLGVKPSQVLLRWALQSGYAIIPKTVDEGRMEENTKLDFIISEEDMASINSISHRNKYAWDPELPYTQKMEFSDRIATLCIDSYKKLGKSGKPLEGKEWTMLSGIVLEQAGDLKVVSLATGTKCIGANAMCTEGSIVNDSHAEVLARRAFIRYMYHQIRIAKTTNNSILKEIDAKYVISEDIKWHLYTSQVPCGDASIIPMEDLVDADEPLTKRQKIDVHRTGAKPLNTDPRQDLKEPGPMYHARGAVRIKPGRGHPTLSLSCSDKIARWIYTGLQGALLSHLIEGSIKLSTVVIGRGGPYDPDVIFNSLVKRSNANNRVPKILHSKIAFDSTLEKVKGGKPAATSIIWCNVPEKSVEVSVEGKRLGATKSSLLKGRLKICKMELFREFLTLCPDSFKSLSYRKAKDAAVEYQALCKDFWKNMGSWSHKPPLEAFFLDNK